jgi:hypothetical protein
MKNTIPVLAVGAFILMSAFSKKSGGSSNSKTEPNDGKDEINPKSAKYVPPITPEPKDANLILCKENEFYNPQTKQCEPFWVDGQTDNMVYEHFNKIINENKLNGDINKICIDVYENGEAQQNKLAQDIIKKTITDLWEEVPMSALPPKESSPKWLKTIWTRVTNLYYKKICNF